MLLSFLEHCSNGCKFSITGEPAKNNNTGNIVDVVIQFDNGKTTRKLIQVKKSINATITKEVLNEFVTVVLDGEDSAELWFAEYVSANKMEPIDKLDKLKQAISTPGFAKNEITGKFGNEGIIISIDDTVNSFSFDGETLKLSAIDTLRGVHKELIEDEISRRYKIDKKYVISNIKKYLNDTLEYRRYLFVDNLNPDPAIKKRLLENEYDFFDKLVVRQINDRELHNEILKLLPSQLNPNGKAILKDVLYSKFYHSSSESQPIIKNEAEQIMKDTMEALGHKLDYIAWDKKDIHGSPYSDIVKEFPEGDYSMGGSQR